MHSLTLRFFLAFWSIIIAMAGLAAGAGYAYSERMREAMENFEMSDTILAASRELEQGGREALIDWLDDQPPASPVNLFVVDAAGDELLGRRIPGWAERLLRRFESRHRHWDRGRSGPDNLLPARPFTRLRGPDGDLYTLFVETRKPRANRWMTAGPVFFAIALALSALVSFVLARAISRPVRTFREATVAISEGKLDTRVADSVRSRRDEIGKLAQDLDSMAAKLEQAADRQKELMRNVSHELRSPLARLRVALELARRDAGDRPALGRIESETERLDQLIGQLLHYARLEASGSEAPERIDLGALLGQVVADANYECRSSGLDKVSVALEPVKNLWIAGDRQGLASAFENVLRNAIHHSPADSQVRVSAASDGDSVEVRVRDLGEGVPDDALAQIFQPFYRSPDAMASAAKGSGLGLAIAARAVEANQGSIRAANLNPGFEVTLRFPRLGE